MSPFDLRLRAALDAAETEFARKGFGGASMRDIARAADMSIAGLYYYLPSKSAALQLVCERAFRALTRVMERAIAMPGTPATQLREFVKGHVDFVLLHPETFRVLLHDIDALEGEARTRIFELRRSYFARAADLVIAVQQQEHSTVSTRVATAALFGMMNWTPMWRHGGGVKAEDIADQMHRLFLRGVTARRPASEVVA